MGRKNSEHQNPLIFLKTCFPICFSLFYQGKFMRCQNLLMLLMLEEQQAPWTERLQEKIKKQRRDGGGCPRPNSLALIVFLCWRRGGLGRAGGWGQRQGSGWGHCGWWAGSGGRVRPSPSPLLVGDAPVPQAERWGGEREVEAARTRLAEHLVGSFVNN